MQIGISSYTYTWAIGVPHSPPPHPMTAIGLLQRAAQLGVHRVQFADNLSLADLSDDDLGVFERRAQELKIAIEIGTRGIDPEHLLRHLQLCQRLQSPLLRIVPDKGKHHPSPGEVVETLKGVMGAFENADIILAIENHDRFTSPTIKGIIEQVGSKHLGVCLDTVNSFGALEGPEVVLGILGPLTVNLHVKDFAVVRASHMMGFSIEGRPAGQGQLNVPWLFETLKNYGRDPSAILELWTPPESNIAATIEKEHNWAGQSVQFLRQHVAD